MISAGFMVTRYVVMYTLNKPGTPTRQFIKNDLPERALPNMNNKLALVFLSNDRNNRAPPSSTSDNFPLSKLINYIPYHTHHTSINIIMNGIQFIQLQCHDGYHGDDTVSRHRRDHFVFVLLRTWYTLRPCAVSLTLLSA